MKNPSIAFAVLTWEKANKQSPHGGPKYVEDAFGRFNGRPFPSFPAPQRILNRLHRSIAHGAIALLGQFAQLLIALSLRSQARAGLLCGESGFDLMQEHPEGVIRVQERIRYVNGRGVRCRQYLAFSGHVGVLGDDR